MKTHVTSTERKIAKKKPFITKIVLKWASKYINAMTGALYPEETKGVKSKNDRHRTFYK
ncbi:hypothetical protein [Aquimarina pacifica]|uniref:hypothetical protein n=1 Tax=Aquimarina pacifica TaxID=1296415 RepID=UPI0004BC04E2|nr:hypothetical protein [Aquimarina pacifica]